MSTTTVRTALPPEARAFLTRLRRALWSLPAADRRETLDGVTAHIADSLDTGATPSAVLLQLGTPEAIAAQAAVEFEARTGRVARPAFLNLARVLQLLAFAYTAAMAFYELLWVQTISVQLAPDGHFEGMDATSAVHQLIHGLLPWYATLPVITPVVITLIALLLTGRAWRPGMRFAAYLLAAFILWTGIREGLPSFLTALWMVGPALALEAAASLAPYRARMARP